MTLGRSTTVCIHHQSKNLLGSLRANSYHPQPFWPDSKVQTNSGMRVHLILLPAIEFWPGRYESLSLTLLKSLEQDFKFSSICFSQHTIPRHANGVVLHGPQCVTLVIHLSPIRYNKTKRYESLNSAIRKADLNGEYQIDAHTLGCILNVDAVWPCYTHSSRACGYPDFITQIPIAQSIYGSAWQLPERVSPAKAASTKGIESTVE